MGFHYEGPGALRQGQGFSISSLGFTVVESGFRGFTMGDLGFGGLGFCLGTEDLGLGISR